MEAEQELELRPAQLNDRFIAWLLDNAPFAVGWVGSLYIVWVVMAKEPPTVESAQQLGLVWLGLLVLYQFAGNLMGGTVGKKLMNVAVVARSGAPLGAGRSLLRALLYPLSFPLFNLGFVVALLHPESRALHDLLSGSLVVEARPKQAAEAWVLFIGAVLSLAAVVAGGVLWQLSLPTPKDRLAVDKAREGLLILAQIQETHKARTGRYTDKLVELAAASGDPESFRQSMGELFVPDQFRLSTDLRGYKISAAARDRKKTRVEISGP